MDNKVILSFIACIAILLIFGKYFAFPLKKIIKLIANSVVGAIIIFVINLVGASFNFHIGFSIINSIIVGILGVPGAALLILIKIFCWKRFKVCQVKS